MEQQKNLEVKAAVKITVSGEVQGVGFRYFIARAASELDINGYVKNLYNGNVEIYAEGRKELLDELVNTAKTGPRHSFVKKAEIEWLVFMNKYNNFEIR
jgi:acylphosphatase